MRDERRRQNPAVLVTAAALSRPDEIDGRRRKYMITMGVRTLAFIAGVALFVAGLQWEAMVVIAVSLVAPIVAVIVANGSSTRTGDAPDYVIHASAENVKSIGDDRTIDG